MRKKKSKHRLWSDIEQFPRTGQCEQCGSISWLYSHEAIRNDYTLTIIENWRCISDKNHRKNIFLDDEVSLNKE